MSATPIVPGLFYRVRFSKCTAYVFARNPVDAICIVLKQLGAI